MKMLRFRFIIYIAATFLLLAGTLNTYATIFYISVSGNDATGTGTSANPWRTLQKATSTVTISGDIIHVNAGTYLETQRSFLAAGVSIEGEGTNSVIQNTISGNYQGVLALNSPEGTNGNQSVSYLKFDGRSETTSRAIEVNGRSNVNIHHCTIVDFRQEGVVINGAGGFTSLPPSIYATGNSFHDNILTNSSEYSTFGTGCLNIGGQDGMLIYNNTITQLQRATGQIGWPIKYYNEGWTKGVKIYNNTITKAPFNGQAWNFALELFNQSGMEIYNNTIQGSLDFNHQTKGGYPYSIYIHDNIIAQSTFNPLSEDGIIIEFEVEGLWIKKNTFRNLSSGVAFYTRPNAMNIDIQIDQNLFADFGNSAAGVGAFVGGFGVGTNAYSIDGFQAYNNTFVGLPGNRVNYGIQLGDCNTGFIRNVSVKNNHFENIRITCLAAGGTVVPDNVNFTYNNVINSDLFGTNGNLPAFANTPTNYTLNNILHVNPQFAAGGNYTLQAGSPLINAGTNVGLPYTGSNPDIGYAEFNVVLPIKLLDFYAIENNGSNLLQWKTATESNSDYFTIERSANGQTYESIGRVTAAGFSSTTINYNFTDANPLKGINYYRLVMVDKNNSFEYSNTIAIARQTKGISILSASIFTGKKQITINVASAQNKKATLAVFDINGRMFLTEPVLLQKGLNIINKNISFTAKGIYYIKLITGDETQIKNILSAD